MNRPHVVIVGAGFGGLTAVRSLGREAVDVTLIDQYNFHTFSPLLYQVATAGVSPDDIAPSVRGVVRREPNADFHMGRVVGIDFDERRVMVAEGGPIHYDYLILAAGAVSSDFGVPGVRDYALHLKSLEDAIHVRTTVLRQFEVADRNASLIDQGALRIVVAGGGPTGVELSGALAELFTKVLAKDFESLDVKRAEVVLIEATGALLGAFSVRSQQEAVRELEARGVEIRLNTAIASVDAEGVELADGTRINSHAVVWCAGVKANPLADGLGLPQTPRGEVTVNHDLSVATRPEVFVIGDLAATTAPPGGPEPQHPPVAMQQARHVARSIVRRRRGKKTRRFRYFDKGTMATIGRRSAVAELPLGIRLGGTLGWLSWLGLHLVFLVGFRNRLVVLVNWIWNYLTWDRGNRIIIPPE